MDALPVFSFSPNDFLQTVSLDDPRTMLLLGTFLGIVVTFASGPMMHGVAALFGTATMIVKGIMAVLMMACLLLKDLLSMPMTWKTYKKVMPWRNVVRSADAPTEIRESAPSSGTQAASRRKTDWYGKEEDLEFFSNRIADRPDMQWKCICRNGFNDYLRYEAYCRVLPGNKTEYKSVTIVKDATAEEMTNFYLDDECRTRWDGMLSKAEVLEEGSVKDRCQVVRWIRSFPFGFLSNREYVIGRRIFRKNSVVYTVSRGIEHAAAPKMPSVVRMDVFYSMWSCRDIACPWGTNKPACEVVLLHHEQFKIPENLARFAACRGMWGFIKSMAPAIVEYVRVQRSSDSGSSSSAPSVRHSSSEISFASSDASTSGATHSTSRNEKPNKIGQTVRRALLAGAVTAVVFVGRSYTGNRRRN